MISLIKVELLKQFKKSSIKVLLLIIFIACLLTVYLTNKKYEEKNIENFIVEIEEGKKYSKSFLEKTNKYNETVEDIIKKNEYYQKEGINEHLKEKSVLNNGITVIIFLSLVIIIISSSIISEEINKKSIKELLTKPHKRSKILLSKIVCMFVLILILTGFVFILFLIFTWIFTKTNVFEIREILIKNNTVINYSFIFQYLKNFIINTIPLFFVSTLSIFISIIIKNSKIVSGLLMFLNLMGTIIFQLFLKFDLNIVQYTFLPYLDLSIYNDIYNIYLLNVEYNMNLNITNGIITLIVSGIIFILLSIIIFQKKDITN